MIYTIKGKHHWDQLAERSDPWVSFEEWKTHEKWYNQAQARLLDHMGLGWIIKFCSDVKQSKNKRIS